jgi:hypothetical protein
MPPNELETRLGRLEQFNEQCEIDRRDLWDAVKDETHERQKEDKEMAKQIRSLEDTRNQQIGGKAVIVGFFVVIGAMLAMMLQLHALGQVLKGLTK